MGSPAVGRAVARLLLLLFFFSGCSGLIYEVVWTRLLRHVMGGSVYAMTTVLCGFMAGLALGSFVAGRRIDRRSDPVRVFAVMEGLIGGYCLLLPVLIAATVPIHRFIYQHFETTSLAFVLIRFVFSGLILLPPATLMGATLPVLTRFFARSLDSVGGSIGRLYAVNTFGAVLGASLGGLVLVPALGTHATLYVGCGLSLLTGALAFGLHRRIGAAVMPGAVRAAPSVAADIPAQSYGRGVGLAVLLGYGLSGLSALVYEVAWSRTITLLIGSSTYAFSLMLTAFILGLALGAALFGRLADRSRDPVRALGVVEILIGLSALAVVPLFGRLPFFLTDLIVRLSESFWRLQLTEFGLICAIMMVPAVLMGAAFPLAVRIYTTSTASVGRSVGAIYSANTLGSIIGAFAGGFLLLPLLGIQNTLLAAVGLNVALGCVFILLGGRRMTLQWRAIACAGVIFLTVVLYGFVPPWDRTLMSFGPLEQAVDLGMTKGFTPARLEQVNRQGRLIFYKEGLCTTVTVRQYPPGERMLFTNAVPDASALGAAPTQTQLAHVPMLLARNPKRVVVVGLATGTTLGTAGLYPVERLEGVELSPGVVEACRLFEDFNEHILDDPRAKIIVEDGRSHLSLTNQTYDVIISQPSNPWVAGVGDLFTREYFEIGRSRLNDGGVFCCWGSPWDIGDEGFRSIIRTFHSVFPQMTLWRPAGGNFFMLGSKGPFAAKLDEVKRRMAAPRVKTALAQVGIRAVEDLFARVVMTENQIDAFAADAPLITDDNALLEFLTPRALLGRRGGAPLREHLEEIDPPDLSLVVDAATEAFVSRCNRVRRGNAAFWKGSLLVQGDGGDTLKLFSQAVRLAPRSAEARFNYAVSLGRHERSAEAVRQLRAALRLNPQHRGANNMLGGIRLQQGRYDEAIKHYQKVLESSPYSQVAKCKLGEALLGAGRPREAIAAYLDALRLNPDYQPARKALAAIPKEAVPQPEWAPTLDPPEATIGGP
ncbi:MAG: fused MFS/spermidine synthase [Phycisphaerae bacterium]